MQSSDLYEAQITSENIQKRGLDIFKWEWEDRFNIVTTKIPTKKKSKVLKILKKSFYYDYNHKTIKKASEEIQQIAASLGSVKEEQFLFASESSNKITLFAVWWPWQSGEYISIKIGLVDSNGNDNRTKILVDEIRNWFEL